MLTPQLMNSMDDAHLVAAVECEINSLTSTPLEIELLGRVEDLLEQLDDECVRAAEEYGLDGADIRALGEALINDAANSAALLAAIGDAGIDTPDDLAAVIRLAKKFESLADGAGDVFARLAALSLTNQE